MAGNLQALVRDHVDAGGLDGLLARQPGFRSLYAEAVGSEPADRRVA